MKIIIFSSNRILDPHPTQSVISTLANEQEILKYLNIWDFI